MKKTKLVVVGNTEASNIGDNLAFMRSLHEPNPNERAMWKRYYASGGDCWLDYPDRVIANGLSLDFYIYGKFLLVDFDPAEYPDHVKLIVDWYENKDTHFLRVDCGGPLVGRAPTGFADALYGVAYRGGSGYAYAQYITNKEAERLGIKS